MTQALFVGIDVGTSGVRAIAIDAAKSIAGQGAARMDAFGADHRDPAVWRAALEAALSALLEDIEADRIAAIAVDGTSGTMVPVDVDGRPTAEPLMYNDPVEDEAVVSAIAAAAPATSAALGANSALARSIVLGRAEGTVRVVHQADWIAGLLSGRFDRSDENNALKTGYDPVARRWPDWIGETGARPTMLPAVYEPGTPVADARGELASTFGIPAAARIVAGTTDGCASFLATGASQPSDGVTALGTTLTVKLFSDEPIFAPDYGIYSHRLAGGWLAGGASNTGGNVLAAHFTAEEIAGLSARIDPHTDTGLGYYPLVRPGERFPISDPRHAPKLSPRPDDDAVFLKGILEGIADIEALAYRRLAELGAPSLRSIRTVGGGAANAVWSAMRRRKLGVSSEPVLSQEAAFGTALLALAGAARRNGLSVRAPDIRSTPLDALAERYGTFFVDQFGVLHDGSRPYPGTAEALRRLKAMSRRVVLLSNSGKRARPNIERLARLGFPTDSYDAMVTSGEVAWHILKDELDAGAMAGGMRCLLLARDDDRSAIEGLDLAEAEDGSDADIVLLSASRGDEHDMDHYCRLLAPAAARAVPCICTNPDKVMLTPAGKRFGAGAIADMYAALGGPVRWIGKPFADIYAFALMAAGNPPPASVCCVGDSVEHDIAGGSRAGLATALVRSGILADMTGAALDALFTEHGVRPDHLLAGFAFETLYREGGP